MINAVASAIVEKSNKKIEAAVSQSLKRHFKIFVYTITIFYPTRSMVLLTN
jgi:hypothetical protein